MMLVCFYCCFTAVLLLFYFFTTSQSGDAHGVWGKHILLLHCCFTSLLPSKVEKSLESGVSIYCCFTAALLLLYFFATSQSGDDHGARGDRTHVFVRQVQYLVEALLMLYFRFTDALLIHSARRSYVCSRSTGPVPSRRV